MSQRYRMGNLAFLLTLILMSGCKDQAPEPAHVRWTLSATTCQGSDVLLLVVDGNVVGTETLSAGQSSQAHDVAPGPHFIDARTQDGSFVWNTPDPVELTSGQTFTRILDC